MPSSACAAHGAEPVFLTYRSRPAVDALIARVIAGAPLCDFTAVDAVQHTIWKVDSLEEHQLVVAFDAVGLVHRRWPSSSRERGACAEQLAGASGLEATGIGFSPSRSPMFSC